MEEAIGDERQAEERATSQPEQRALIFRIDGMQHPFGKQRQARVPDRPSVPASPGKDCATQEQSEENANIAGTYRKLVIVYFP